MQCVFVFGVVHTNGVSSASTIDAKGNGTRSHVLNGHHLSNVCRGPLPRWSTAIDILGRTHWLLSRCFGYWCEEGRHTISLSSPWTITITIILCLSRRLAWAMRLVNSLRRMPRSLRSVTFICWNTHCIFSFLSPISSSTIFVMSPSTSSKTMPMCWRDLQGNKRLLLCSAFDHYNGMVC